MERRWSRRAGAYGGMALGAFIAFVVFATTFPLRSDIQLAYGMFGITLSVAAGGVISYVTAMVHNWTQRRDRIDLRPLAISLWNSFISGRSHRNRPGASFSFDI